MAFEPQQHHDDNGQPMQADQAQQQGGALAASYEQDDGDYEYDEPKKRSSLLMVVGALSAAIVVGGGAAYVYQRMLGGNGAQIAAPLIKGDPNPSKTKPADAGGKQFAHTGSKVMGRVNDGSAPPEGSGDVDASGARRVTTLPVGRDGSIAAPAPIAPVTPAVAVPGLTIVDGFGRPPQAPIAPPQPPQQAAAPVIVQPPPSAPAKPVMIARAAPTTAVIPAAPAVSDVAEEAPAAPVAPKVVKKPPSLPKKKVVDAFGATTGAVATAPASTGGSGFVPVLVSIPAAGKTNADALAQFADMRARYAGVLDGREPVIKEIDRGDKGLYYRVMAGPPGSKEQANALCEQLKAQGHKDCWVSGY